MLNSGLTYKPLQPFNGTESAAYEEFRPRGELQRYVYCFWQLSSQSTISGFNYRVCADGATDLIFDATGKDNAMISVTGDVAGEFKLSGRFNYFGIRFYPASLHYFFDVPLSGLTGQTVQAGELVGHALNQIQEEISSSANICHRVLLAETFLIARLRTAEFTPDPRVVGWIRQLSDEIRPRVIKDCFSERITSRHQRRIFEHYTGLSPKTFSKILRFQQTLNAMLLTSVRDRQLFFDFGYYDQSHFIRDFKRFYGDTPNRLKMF